jgi:DNA-directed RNA polymerase specialized sigma24 family protein
VEPESPEPSPIEAAIGAEAAAAYDRALATLSDADRELIVAHVEFSCSHEELARLTGKTSANTARIALRRALARLAAAMATDNG